MEWELSAPASLISKLNIKQMIEAQMIRFSLGHAWPCDLYSSLIFNNLVGLNWNWSKSINIFKSCDFWLNIDQIFIFAHHYIYSTGYLTVELVLSQNISRLYLEYIYKDDLMNDLSHRCVKDMYLWHIQTGKHGSVFTEYFGFLFQCQIKVVLLVPGNVRHQTVQGFHLLLPFIRIVSVPGGTWSMESQV